MKTKTKNAELTKQALAELAARVEDWRGDELEAVFAHAARIIRAAKRVAKLTSPGEICYCRDCRAERSLRAVLGIGGGR